MWLKLYPSLSKVTGAEREISVCFIHSVCHHSYPWSTSPQFNARPLCPRWGRQQCVCVCVCYHGNPTSCLHRSDSYFHCFSFIWSDGSLLLLFSIGKELWSCCVSTLMKCHDLDSAAILLTDLCQSVIHLRSLEAHSQFAFRCYNRHSVCKTVHLEIKWQKWTNEETLTQ